VVELKTPGEIEAIRAAGKVVARVLGTARAHAAPGVTLKELDEAAREVLKAAGATSPFLNYKPRFAPIPYPAVICTSVNDAALHGIPDGYKLKLGDLLSVDAGATLDGWVGDAAISFTVGEGSPEDARLIATCEDALKAGIAAAIRRYRHGRAQRRLRDLHPARRSRRRPDHARGPARPQRRQGEEGHEAPARTRHRDRAVVHGRR
jgi:methionyl aminopeptidase